jgi:hypothetical protein
VSHRWWGQKKESLSSFAKTLSGFVPSPRYFAKPSKPLTRLSFSSALCAVDGYAKCKRLANLVQALEHASKLLHLHIIYSGNVIYRVAYMVPASIELTKFVTVNRWKLSKFVAASAFSNANSGFLAAVSSTKPMSLRTLATREGFSAHSGSRGPSQQPSLA